MISFENNSLIEQINKLLSKTESNKKVAISKDQNSISVSDVSNSKVYIIGTVADDQLADLKNDLKDDFDEFTSLIRALLETLQNPSDPVFRYFQSIAELKSLTKDNSYLFEHDLNYFTEQEIKGHDALIDYLINERFAMLIGNPATGKTITVVEIAERLKNRGIKTYYYSHKQSQRWNGILEELLSYEGRDIVFVIDDVHLQPNETGFLYNKIRQPRHEHLNVLFVSRPAFLEKVFQDTLNVYQELESVTVWTEKPNLDKKVAGITQLFQQHYQANLTGSFPVGNLQKIISNVHRNLISLRAYLKLWVEFPDTKLSDLDEEQLYKNIYAEYFDPPNKSDNYTSIYLQYLCLYYFEKEFYLNPKSRYDNQVLINLGHIIEEHNGLWSVFHAEYAALLLNAYKFQNDTRHFKKIGNSWEHLFLHYIKSYIESFDEEDVFPYPENLLEFFITIPRFRRDITGGLEHPKNLAALLLNDETISKAIKLAGEDEEDDRVIFLFLITVLDIHASEFQRYFELFGESILKSPYLIVLYCKAIPVLPSHEWLTKKLKPYLTYAINNCPIRNFSQTINILKKTHADEAKALFLDFDNNQAVERINNASLNEVSNALNELKNIDNKKTRELHQLIDTKVLIKMVEKSSINEVGKGLSELKNIDNNKTLLLYKSIDNDILIKKIRNARINELSYALNELKNLDEKRTQKIYQDIDVDYLIMRIENAKINDVGNALSELKNIDFKKTKILYRKIDIHRLKTMIKHARINQIGYAMNQLNNIDNNKTRKLYLEIENEFLIRQIEAAKIKDVGTALNELKNIDLQKTIQIYRGIENKTLKKMFEEAKISEVGKSLNELKKVENDITNQIYQQIDNVILINKIKKASIQHCRNAFIDLQAIDEAKTESISLATEDVIFNKMKNFRSSYANKIQVISNFSWISSSLGKRLFDHFPFDELIQEQHIQNLHTFNGLLQLLINIEKPVNGRKGKAIMEFGLRNATKFLRRTDLRLIGNFIFRMKSLNVDLSYEIKYCQMIIRRNISNKDLINEIPYFLSTIFLHDPDFTTGKLLRNISEAFPQNDELINQIYLEIAKRGLESNNLPQATTYLAKATALSGTQEYDSVKESIANASPN